MAVYAYTNKPNTLLREIKKAIIEEKIDTWTCDNDGDFTHSPYQWQNQAWFQPKIIPGMRIVFNIIPPRGKKITRLIYGLYHGRLIEMLLVHFDDQIDRVAASALPSTGDNIG